MKKIILFLLVAYTSTVNAQEFFRYIIPSGKTDAEILGLKGKVKSVLETSQSAAEKFGDVTPGDPIKSDEYSYTKKGMLTKKITVISGSKAKFTDEYDYNSNDQLKQIERSSVDQKSVFTYDANGRVSEVDFYYKNAFDGREKFKYNAQGKLISIINYDRDGDRKYQRDYTWNEKNQLTKDITVYSNGNIYQKHLFTYDSKGNIESEEYTRPNYKGDLRKKTAAYEYNGLGQITAEISSDEMSKTTDISYFFSYDSNGNMIKKTYRNNEGTDYVFEYTYTYDSNQNWTNRITKTTIASRKPTYVIDKRDIKYW